MKEARELFEREYLQQQIRGFGGNISKTARFIHMERSALHRKLKSLEINLSKKQNDTTGNGASDADKIPTNTSKRA